MTDTSNDVEKLERISEQVADSVLELADEAILAEIAEFGADPKEEAERIRLLLRQVSKAREVLSADQRTASRHLAKGCYQTPTF